MADNQEPEIEEQDKYILEMKSILQRLVYSVKPLPI